MQVAKAEAEVREQAGRLADMKALQTEVESLRERLRAAQQQCNGLEATASLVPGLKSQVSVLTKQVPQSIASEIPNPSVLCNMLGQKIIRWHVHFNRGSCQALMQAEEAEHLRKDRDDKRTSLSAVQEEVQMHREQVRSTTKAPLASLSRDCLTHT